MASQKPTVCAGLRDWEIYIQLYAKDLGNSPIFWHRDGRIAGVSCCLGRPAVQLRLA